MVVRRKMNEFPLGKVQETLADQIRDKYSSHNGIFSLCLAPVGPYQVPDDGDRPLLVVMDYQSVASRPDADSIPPEVEDIFEHKGTDSKPRKYRNNLVFLVVDESWRENLIEYTRKFLALKELTSGNAKDVQEHQRNELADRKRKMDMDLSTAILQCYRHLFYPAKTAMQGAGVPLAYLMLGLPTEKAGKGQLHVEEGLREVKKLIAINGAPPAASYIRDSTPLKALGEMTTRQLRDEFRCVPKLPILEHDTPLNTLVRDGIGKEVFVYREGANQITGPGDPLGAIHIDDNSFVMTMEHAKAKHFWPRPEALKATLRTSSDTVPPGSTVDLTLEVSGGVGPYTYSSSLSAFQHPTPTTGSVLTAKVTFDATKTFSVEVVDSLGNKNIGAVWIKVEKGAQPPTKEERGTDGVIILRTPVQPRIELKVEGVLVTALKELWAKARQAKVEKLQRVIMTMHDPIATWKVHMAMMLEKSAVIACDFHAELSAEGVDTLTLSFQGSIAKADNVRSFLEGTLKTANEKNLHAIYTLQFTDGLSLAGSDPETLTKNLTKFGGAEVLVEAYAQDEQEEVAA